MSAWAGKVTRPTVSLDSALAIFQAIDTSLGTDPAADSLTDTLQLNSGDGVNVTGNSAADSVSFAANLTSGGGLIIASGGISLMSCSDDQILKQVAGAWACAADNAASLTAYRQHLADADNVTVASTLTPLLTNGSGTPLNVAITPESGNEVAFIATVEISTTLATGPATLAVIRDDNNDNDCATGGGDGTVVGGQVTSFIASVAQSFTTTFSFIDSAPTAGTNRYQLCASATIALGTASATDRSLRLSEINN